MFKSKVFKVNKQTKLEIMHHGILKKMLFNIGKNINLACCDISYIFTAFTLSQKKLMAFT